MMMVVDDQRLEDEPELTWEEAVALFDEAEPVDVPRSPHTVVIQYVYENGRWRASSPELKGFEVRADSLAHARELATADLAGFLDESVPLAERVVEPATSRGFAQKIERGGFEP